MQEDEIPSVEELREHFLSLGVYGIKALLTAQQKYIDLQKGVNLPDEFYITGVLPVEGEIC